MKETMLERKQENFNEKYLLGSDAIYINTKEKISIFSVVADGWQLASASFANEKKTYRIKQQLKSSFGALTNPYFTSKWYQILKSPDFLFVTAHRKRIYLKPYRVYMSTKWTKKQKIKIICDTYKFILNKGEAFKNVISSKQALEIANIKLNDGIEASINLGYDERFRKEGELVFSLNCDQFGGRIVAAAFSFEEISTGQWVCRIGCIQGNKNAESASKKIQKLLNGLRPKSLIIFAVQQFAKQLGCTAIYGSGDSIHAYRQKHAIHLPWLHTIKFDYDIIWNESGGHQNSDGWFELPLTSPRKSQEELKSHKRALYRRRYAQMDEISSKIEASVKNLL